MAEIVAKVVGHRVRPVDVPFWLFSKTARWSRQGVGPFSASALRHYVEDVKTGAFAFEGGVTDTVEALTGMPAESSETDRAALRCATFRAAISRQSAQGLGQIHCRAVVARL